MQVKDANFSWLWRIDSCIAHSDKLPSSPSKCMPLLADPWSLRLEKRDATVWLLTDWAWIGTQSHVKWPKVWTGCPLQASGGNALCCTQFVHRQFFFFFFLVTLFISFLISLMYVFVWIWCCVTVCRYSSRGNCPELLAMVFQLNGDRLHISYVTWNEESRLHAINLKGLFVTICSNLHAYITILLDTYEQTVTWRENWDLARLS